MDSTVVHVASFAELSKVTLYKLLELRGDVFNVEQRCTDNDLDGRDMEPDTRHLWMEYEGFPIAAARTMVEFDNSIRIGRVCTHHEFRGRGLAAQLVKRACAMDASVFVMDAQLYLQKWYEGFGFVVDGAEFMDAGVPHIPMKLIK